MGHQVNFFLMPADLPDLETAIRAAGDICFLAEKSPTGEPVELASIAAALDWIENSGATMNGGATSLAISDSG